MTEAPDLSGAEWLSRPGTCAVFEALGGAEGRTRAVGGIVRDTLLGEQGGDVDMASELTPDEVIARAEAAGIAAHPTGIEHGTVTLSHEGQSIEVTTLRQDVKTDGRHAEVVFGTDWVADAKRRDFTMNALYADMNGVLFDPLFGLEDCLNREVRFIGLPEDRIKEDYLRILRLFRFFARFGKGRPDAAALKAVTRLKSGISQLSVERVWSEMKALLGTADPTRALLWMRTTGVLAVALPEGEKWGIDAIHPLIAVERQMGWNPDPMLRLEAILPPMDERIGALGDRLKLSKAERARLDQWAKAETPASRTNDMDLAKILYRGNPPAIADRLRLLVAAAWAKDPGDAAIGRITRMIEQADQFEKPVLPVAGRDLLDRGFEAGPGLGQALSKLEDAWIDSDFTLSRQKLIDLAGAPE
ncbi:CCA tRNA nucleotidyltransferase [Cucumibacter marinus]|uniref:CCA tRNA nucleotidyltransferase n=1 Tax=Cucumibacter marinus TaxID=1121252 RepID=UPI0003F9444B|nr:CCA tRNA nucleotidyltransferase [Cucumibacter marinus]